MRKSALVVWTLLLTCLVIVASAVAAKDGSPGPGGAGDHQVAYGPQETLQIGTTVVIEGRSYLVINALRAVGLIPHRTVKMVSTLIRQCPRANAWGYLATRPVDVGVVASVPTNILDCWFTGEDVTGGGPIDPPPRVPCLQGFRTPNRRLYVVFAGTSGRVCPHIATQAPGAAWGTTQYDVQGLPAGSELPVKCQIVSGGVLWDFMASYASKLPASKDAWWVQDQGVETGYRDWIFGVPSCWGTRFQW